MLARRLRAALGPRALFKLPPTAYRTAPAVS
jgi:hypothetical protein